MGAYYSSVHDVTRILIYTVIHASYYKRSNRREYNGGQKVRSTILSFYSTQYTYIGTVCVIYKLIRILFEYRKVT